MPSLKKFLSKNWQYLVLVSVVLFLYAGSVNNAFISDDVPTYVKNEKVQNYTDLTFLEKINIQKLIYYVTYQTFGMTPVPLHVLSIILHIINAVLFYNFAKEFFGEKISFSGAILFAVHPINSETVLWISAINYLIAFMLNMIIFRMYSKAKDIKSLILPIIFYIFVLVITFNVWMLLTPFVLFFGALIKGDSFKNVSIRSGIFFLTSILVFFVLFRSLAVARSEYIVEISENMPLKLLPLTLPYSIGSTAKLLFFPNYLTLYHEGEFALPIFIRSSRIILLFVALAELYLFIKHKRLFYVSAMVFVSILPSLSPVRMSNFFAERYVYFGSAFFCILISYLIEYVSKKAKTPELFYLLLFGFVVASTYKVMVRSAEWKDPVTFWEATVRESPNSAGAFNNLGIEYVKVERFEDALVQFQKSVKINPNVPDAQYNIGKILLVGGRYDLAEPYLLNALRIAPKEPKIIQAVNDLNAIKQAQ